MDAAVKRPLFRFYKDGEKVDDFIGDSATALEVSGRWFVYRWDAELTGSLQRSIAAHAH